MRSNILLILLLLSLVGRVARAEDKQAAKAAFAEGRRSYALNEFEAALDAFKRAYLCYEDPSFLFNIAQCHRALGHKGDAIKFYRSYLRDQPDAANADDVRRTIKTLESELADEKPAPVAPTPTAASTTLVASAPPPRAKMPAYKKWWVWTIVGVAAAGAATGIALAFTQQKSEGAFMPVTVTR